MRRHTSLLLALVLVLLLALGQTSALGTLALSEGRVEVASADAGSVSAVVGIPDRGGADVSAVGVAVAGVPFGAEASWIVPSAGPNEPVSPPLDVPFTLTVTVPPRTPGGTYRFQLVATADGAEVGRASLDVAVPGEAGCTGPELTVDRATFDPRWRQSRVRGTLILRGRVCQATSISVVLRRRGARATRPIWVWVPRPTRRLRVGRLPRGLLPGVYTIQVEGTGPGIGTARRATGARLRPPREGVVRAAFASGIRNGPPAVTLPGRRLVAFATFRFAALPARGQRITTAWVPPSGRSFPQVLRRPNGTVEAFVQAPSDRFLVFGQWLCILRAGGRIVHVLVVPIVRR